ncbi:MAG: Imm17 family immunity protein [Flavobacteriaceae bacterium]
MYRHFLDKNWAITPNSSRQRFFYETFGRTGFRIASGIFFIRVFGRSIRLYLL